MQSRITNSICFITVSHPMYGYGGAEIQTYLLAKQFAKSGWNVSFLTKIKGKKTSEFDDNSIRVLRYRESSFFFITWIRIAIIFFTNYSEVYYFRHHHSLLGILTLLCKIFNRKIFWAVMHDEYCKPEVFHANLLKKYKRYPSVIKNLKSQLELVLYKIGINGVRGIITQNRAQYETVLNNFNRRSEIIYNSHPVPIDKNNRRENQVLFISTMKDFKQPELFAELALRCNGINFIAIGENFPENKKAETLLERFHSSGVRYLGMQSLDTVNEFLLGTKLLINTSLSEGFPNTYIQAWLRGVPVVSLNIDPDGLIKANNLGYVCEGNISLASEKIKKLISDQSLWEEFSKNCRNFAKSNFDLVVTTEKLKNLFMDEGK